MQVSVQLFDEELVDDVEAVLVRDDLGDLVDGEMPQRLVDRLEVDPALRQAGHESNLGLDRCRIFRLKKTFAIIFFTSHIYLRLPRRWRC